MKVYTKTGDKGTTSLIGERTDKDDLRIEAYGTIDTLNSNLNLVMSTNDSYNEELIRVCRYLFVVSHDLAQTNSSKYKVDESEIIWLESKIDELIKKIDDFNYFVLPGGTETASRLHICRCICRECERKIVSASKVYECNEYVITYVNRLSDYIFMLACYENFVNNVELVAI